MLIEHSHHCYWNKCRYAQLWQLPCSSQYAVAGAGVLLWSMLTGLRPWNRMSRVQVMVNICIQKKTLDVPDGLPPDLAVRLSPMMVA